MWLPDDGFGFGIWILDVADGCLSSAVVLQFSPPRVAHIFMVMSPLKELPAVVVGPGLAILPIVPFLIELIRL